MNKKKILASLVLLIFAISIAMVSVACKLNFTRVEDIQFSQTPKTTFQLNEKLNFSIKVVYVDEKNEARKTIFVNYDDGKVTYDLNDNEGIKTERVKVTGFDTKLVGTFKAVVVYEQMKLEFDYTVIDPNAKYGGGDGSELSPYLVSTVEQFQNMLNEKSFKYYKITNDIDFANTVLQSANAGCDIDKLDGGMDNLKTKAWAGVVDGQVGTSDQNYSLLNLGSVKKFDGSPANKDNELFGCVGSSTNGKFELRNLNINFASTNGYSPVFSIACNNGYNAEIAFRNVHVTGTMDFALCNTSWAGVFMNKVGYHKDTPCKSLVIENCSSKLNMLNTYPRKTSVSGFITVSGQGTVNMLKYTNCTFGGRIEGAGTKAIGVFTTVVNQGIFTNSEESAQAFANNSIKYENCKILSTATIVSNVADKVYATAYTGTGTSLTSTGVTVENTVDTSIKPLTVEIYAKDKQVTVTPDTSIADQVASYRIFVHGNMMTNGKGGTFTYYMPSTEALVNGKLTNQQLLTLAYNANSNESIGNGTYGSNAIGLVDGRLLYNCKGVCESVDITSASLTIVALNAQGKVIGYCSKDTKVNLAA